jgi:regulation of enolase protein 1 (concanavalin A-like superfamily)
MTNPLSTGEWLREPAHAMVDNERVRFTTSPGTDLWQRTYYGFRNDNAPALLLPASSNMTLTVRVSFQYRRRYDQAGVLVHLNADTWAKASVEHENDVLSRLGSVVTNSGYSDWATRDIPSTRQMWYRVSRRGPDFRFEAGPDGIHWEQLRIFHLHRLGETTEEMGSAAVLPDGSTVGIGVYACSPEDSSFEAQFDQIRLQPSVWQPHTT